MLDAAARAAGISGECVELVLGGYFRTTAELAAASAASLCARVGRGLRGEAHKVGMRIISLCEQNYEINE